MPHMDMTAHGIITHGDRVLLVITNKGWSLPGGKLIPGQGALEAMKHELWEETGGGWTYGIDGLCAVYMKCGEDGMPRKVMFTLRRHYVSGTPVPSSEIHELEWSTMDEARERLASRMESRWTYALEDALMAKETWPVFRVLGDD